MLAEPAAAAADPTGHWLRYACGTHRPTILTHANACILRIDGINAASTAGNILGTASLFNDTRAPAYPRAAIVSGSRSKQVVSKLTAQSRLCLVGLKFALLIFTSHFFNKSGSVGNLKK